MGSKVANNKILKQLLEKALVLLFCIVFVKSYVSMFGAENNIISIVLIVGLLVFSKVDLGYDVKQATLSLFGMFILITFASKLSLVNPFLGMFINIVTIGSILVLSSYIPEMECHTNILMCYLFCQGYNVSGQAFRLRVISLLIGALAIAGIYYVTHKKNTYTKTIKDVVKELKNDTDKIHWCLRMTISLTVVMFVGDIINMPRTMWIALTVLSLTRPKVEEVKYRAINRVIGATAGIAVFVLLYMRIDSESLKTAVLFLTGYVVMFVNNYGVKSGFNAFTALISSLVFFEAEMSVVLRIITNVAGVVFAVIVSLISFKIVEVYNAKQTSKLEKA